MASIDYDYTTIVVGSGFGGSVATHRLAEAYRDAKKGDNVCLLERGKAYAPGEFARAPWAFAKNFWQPKKGLHGLFDVWSFKHCEAVVSAGLGGGSLIYSNALVRPPPAWLSTWPISYASLEPHYSAIEQMLDAQPFPAGMAGYTGVAKATAMEQAAMQIGKAADFEFVRLAVSFRNGAGTTGVGIPLRPKPYGNYHRNGLARTTCTLCCQCNIGCNQGSKNTLDHTYISEAVSFGAEVRIQSEVTEIRPLGDDGYEITYLDHREGEVDEKGEPVERTLRCRRLILAAGTFGTTYLLMKNKSHLPALSSVLGQRFSTNGDFLMWMSGARQPGPADKPLHLYPSVGLPVTMAIKYRDFYVEDAGYPVILDWILAAKAGLIRRAIVFVLRYLWAWLTRNTAGRISSQLALLVGSGEAEASSLPLGAMGLDKPEGRMALLRPRKWFIFKRRRRLQVDWSMKTSEEYFDGVKVEMQRIAGAFRAKIAPTALSTLGRTITVHPLGGCPMGTSADTAVCDHHGEVFGYENLFVADGAAMPTPIGANPSLTIAAFSRRMADAIVHGETRRS